MDWQINGHKRQIRLLNSALNKQVFSHAYLFAGPKYIGKKQIALRFAQAVLCQSQSGCGNCHQCRMSELGTNPDLFLIGDTQDDLNVESIREFCYKISLKPFSAKFKLAIINNADSLNDSSANAILKTLEEPSASSIIILISSNLKAILPTIRSRTHIINFGYVRRDEYQKSFDDKLAGLSLKERDAILEISEGQPALLELMLNDKDTADKMINFAELGSQISSEQFLKRHLAIQKILDTETDDLRNLLQISIAQFRRELLQRPNFTSAYNVALLDKSIGLIEQKCNPKLILTGLALGLK